MKTSAIILALATFVLGDVVLERDTTPTTTAPATTESLSPELTCLAACSPGDVTCEAACVGAAHPNSAQVNQTDVCVANCPQGDGSQSESDIYAQCVAGCISSYYPTTQTVGPVSVGGQTTTAAAGATTSGAQTQTSATTTGSGSSTGSASGAAATTTSSKNAGVNNAPYIASVGGFVGLFLAFFAL